MKRFATLLVFLFSLNAKAEIRGASCFEKAIVVAATSLESNFSKQGIEGIFQVNSTRFVGMINGPLSIGPSAESKPYSMFMVHVAAQLSKGKRSLDLAHFLVEVRLATPDGCSEVLRTILIARLAQSPEVRALHPQPGFAFKEDQQRQEIYDSQTLAGRVEMRQGSIFDGHEDEAISRVRPIPTGPHAKLDMALSRETRSSIEMAQIISKLSMEDPDLTLDVIEARLRAINSSWFLIATPPPAPEGLCISGIGKNKNKSYPFAMLLGHGKRDQETMLKDLGFDEATNLANLKKTGFVTNHCPSTTST